MAGDLDGRIVGKGDFDAQMKQVLSNIEKGLKSVEASFANVVQFTTYLVHSQDIANFRRVREELFPTMFPTHRYPTKHATWWSIGSSKRNFSSKSRRLQHCSAAPGRRRIASDAQSGPLCVRRAAHLLTKTSLLGGRAVQLSVDKFRRGLALNPIQFAR